MNARVLKFHIHIPNDKIVDPYFFVWPSYAPFLSYVPLKTKFEKLVCKISQKVRGGFRKFCHRCYNFVNRHNRLLYYTLIERATFLLYNDAKTMHEKK